MKKVSGEEIKIMLELKSVKRVENSSPDRIKEDEYINPVIASIIMDAKKNPERYIREYKIPAEGE
ncbi:MAG: hypothetical protein AB2L14_12695 [Candidatus Xenobiia bacterium LiM19]